MSPGPRPLPHESPGCYSPDDAEDECSPPPVLAPPSLHPPPSDAASQSHGRSTFVTALIVASSVLAFLAIGLSILILVRRRRLRRQREAAHLEAALAFPDDGDGGPGDGEGEEVVHHAWHIRTVGLDEAAIRSIALARYRAGGGAPGASDDCTVCLAEFRDGELVRLLPRCAHAFHVQCIDTWLRAHVTCPLCRANVIDTASDAAAEQPDPTPPGAGAEQEDQDAGEDNIGAPEHEQQRVDVDQLDQPDISSDQPRQRPCPRLRTFRRVASMDSPPPVASAEEAALPEHGQAGGEKQGTGDAVCRAASPGSEHLNRAARAAMKRSLSAGSRWTLLSRSRPCRPRSSLLPL
ncbi:unnamed protein product [Urochloa decumbens]|uniref:RING-type E3 ubiquitin transferase n=1 Tax=Urochloa decumbens TaxID=240449 RepID=A0ABC9EIK5_9POAL